MPKFKVGVPEVRMQYYTVDDVKSKTEAINKLFKNYLLDDFTINELDESDFLHRLPIDKWTAEKIKE